VGLRRDRHPDQGEHHDPAEVPAGFLPLSTPAVRCERRAASRGPFFVKRNAMNRYRAAATHLAISATLISVVFLLIYFMWYPGPLFDTAGGSTLFMLILGVDLTVGPLVTLIVFVPGKKGMVFDLWVIGILQSAFLAYGVWSIAESRPVYIAFVKDRFELARANQTPDSVLADAKMNRYLDMPWTGPRLVGVRFPTDADAKFNLMVSGLGGVDIQSYPQYHVPYDEVRKQVVAHAAPLKKLEKFNKNLSSAELARKLGRPEDAVGFLPLRAGKYDLTVLVDAKNGDVIKIAELKPWEYE
jgi:hypothetical protein